ncbi:MAG: DNA cytosine methyltransferase [Clostridia bacterium]|nr:DNA cytosine methyltransferase [Clostridia bacterium]
MIKLLIGGSPCTYWSIAQKNNREVKAEGLGWELFNNYLIAKEKFNPDYFLYENNKSAAPAIKEQIKRELNVVGGGDARYIEINSALVSAQNRQRFYVHNFGKVEQPEDRGILLKDILENGCADKDKAYCLKHQAGNTRDYFKKHHTQIKFEPCILQEGHGFNKGGVKTGKCPTLTTEANSYTKKVFEPCCCPVGVGYRNRREENGKLFRRFETHNEEKANALTTVRTDSMVAEPYIIPLNLTVNEKSQCLRAAYNKDGVRNMVGNNIKKQTCVAIPCGQRQTEKSRTITAGYQTTSQRDFRMDIETNGFMGKQGVIEEMYPFAVPISFNADGEPIKAISGTDGKFYDVYKVSDGFITIKDKQYPIKLPDGFYVIRKLTVTECCRLQTLPDDYCRAVSASQAYKGLGNGWTAEVIIHIMRKALDDIPRNEKLLVLSMYDGIGTGHYCLDKMGFTNVEYHAYEIDKYAMTVARSNYPDIIYHGDAFNLRNNDWEL